MMDAKEMKLQQSKSALLVVDMQERLQAAMEPVAMSRVQQSVKILIQGAAVLGIPILWTEQYPKGLGPTAAELAELLKGQHGPLAKTGFSCLAEPSVRDKMASIVASQWIVCGMEAHVCVYQTVRDLRALGQSVFVPTDGVLSRTEQNRQIGLGLMQQSGAVLSSTEAILFDLLERAGSAQFKAISALVK